MGEDEYKMTISSRITPKRGLEFLEAFLVGKIDFLHELEPTINALSRMEAYEDTLKALDQIMERTKVAKKVDRSHSRVLSV